MSELIDRFVTFPTLRTKRLVLRQMHTDDAFDLFSFYQDAHFAKYLDWSGPASIEECQSMIDSWNRSFDERTLIPWGITQRDTDRLIGTVMFMAMRGTFADTPRYPLTVSYDLKRDYWKKGFMSEALRAALDFTLKQIGPHRIQAEVVPENTASLKLLKKLGFQEEGVLKHYLMHEASHMFLNVVIMALLAT